MNSQFRFDIPLDTFIKGGETATERRIGGICTTDGLDRQSEIVLADGLDFEPFLKGGWFNDNHDDATDSVVGYPIRAEMKDLGQGRKGWYVEGFMLKGDGTTRADKLWKLANSLQKTDRRLGFSVEGKILERDPENPHIVRKAVVSEVAITKCPVNTETSLAVLAKSLSAGSAVSAPGVATPGDGFALRTESLEGRAPQLDEEDEDEKDPKKRKMKKSEAIALLMKLRPGVTREHAELIVNYALRHYPAA